jgi:hypothetical protein
MRSALTFIAALVAVVAWRNGRIIKNNILTLTHFPAGYYTAGDWTTKCETVKDEKNRTLRFCEDETFWDLFDEAGKLLERRVILSCDPGRREWNTVMGPLLDPIPRGGLWVYTPQAEAGQNLQRLALTGYPEGHDFHPLGLEIYPSYAGNSSNLFVINHARHRTVIEQFSMSPADFTQAVWVRTLASNYFVSPNSLALTSPTSFYVTNDHLLTRRLPSLLGHTLPVVETILALPLSWLAHVTLEEHKTSPPIIHHEFAALGVAFANGVAVSSDGQLVAVAATSRGQVYFYSRSLKTNVLKHIHTVPVPFTPDNLMFDDQGSLIVTGHPHFPSLIGVAAGKPGAVSPSWVVSISPRPQAEAGTPAFSLSKQYDLRAPTSASSTVSPVLSHEVETLFQSNGTGFSSSCTALRDSPSGVLYVTGLYEEGLLVCKP